MRHLWRLALEVALVCVIMATAARADVNYKGMVTKTFGTELVISIGNDKGMQTGTELYLYRQGVPVAKVKVIEVDDYTSIVTVTDTHPDQPPKVGDVVSDTPFLTVPPPATSGSAPLAAASPQPATSGEAEQAYETMLASQTKSASFKVGGTGKVTVPLRDVLNMAAAWATTSGSTAPQDSSLGITNVGGSSPYYLLMLGQSAYSEYQYNKQQNPASIIVVDVTYWDQPLTEAYASYYAFKEAASTPAQQAQVKQAVYQGKAVDKYLVFQVHLRNNGAAALQVAPFNWHMYLIADNGQRVKAERYDDALDKSLSPAADAGGFVYFPRTGADGRPVVAKGPVHIVIEDILGKKGDLTW